MADHPVSQVNAADCTDRDHSLVGSFVDINTMNRPASDHPIKFVRGLGTAAVLQAIVATAKLIGLRRIDPEQTNALPMYLNRVAVDDGCLPGQWVGLHW